MATEVQERQQNATPEQRGDGLTHPFMLEQTQRGFAEVNTRINRLMIALIAGMFGTIALIIGVPVASFLS